MPQPSLLLIHGQACGAWMWDAWRRHLRALGWQVNVLDLRGHGRSMPIDLSEVTLEDYVADVASVTVQIEAAQGIHPVVGGWGMGALVAMMYGAQHAQPPAQLLVAPMAPVEVAGRAPIELVRAAAGAVLGPEAFGVPVDDRDAAREALPDLSEAELEWLLGNFAGEQESGIAYRQALRGVSMPPGACPTLVLYGAAQAEEERRRAVALAEYLSGDAIDVPSVGHWGIVCNEESVAGAAPAVDAWLRSTLAGELA